MGAKRGWRRVLRIGALVGCALLVGLGGWLVLASRPSAAAVAAMGTDARVKVERDPSNGVIRFTPASTRAVVPVGLLFFSSAMVDVVAYAPLARAAAAAGYPVILVPLKRRGLFIKSDLPDILHVALGAVHEDERAAQWLVGGHSLGATIAIRMVTEVVALGARSMGGLLLVGTTNPRSEDLSSLKLPVTKIVATNDGLAPLANSEANRRLLPASARWVRIEGGNHSQFGWYGFQPGDHVANISRDAQHEQLINAVLEALRLSGDIRRPTTVPLPFAPIAPPQASAAPSATH